jgi:hypothetical protein
MACLLLVAGCTSPHEGRPAPALGPQSAAATSSNLSLADIPPDADWAVFEIDPRGNQVVLASATTEVAFPSGVDQEWGDCYVVSLQGTGPFNPVVTAQTISPSMSDAFVNHERVGARSSGNATATGVTSTGTGGQLLEQHLAGSDGKTPLHLLLGAPRDEARRPQSVRVELTATHPFTVRLLAKGYLTCVTGFEDLSGPLAQEPGSVAGEELSMHIPVKDGLAAYVQAGGNTIQANLQAPDGSVAWEVPASQASSTAFLCSPQAGDWTLAVPSVAGTPVSARLHAVFVDLPPSLQDGYACHGLSAQP